MDLVDFREKLRENFNLHHRNIINLMGACGVAQYLYLMYEYVEGPRLAELQRGRKFPGYTVLSSWLSRMKISLDLAQGIEYIHHYTSFSYVDKYMKSNSVIILDPDFKERISHFGTYELSVESSIRESLST